MTAAQLTPEDRYHRTSKALAGVTFLVAIAVLGLLVLTAATFAASRAGADNSGRVQESTDIAACRALARVPIDEARTDIEALILDGLTAAAAGDLSESSGLLADADQAQARLEEATAFYKAEIEQSQADPAGFLTECHQGQD